MILDLPKKFESSDFKIVGNTLIIYCKIPKVEKIMYLLTYKMRNSVCVYCNKKLRNTGDKTLDHRYPRATGGVTITNNLFPCCISCNQKKSDLLHEEYLKVKSLQKTYAKDYLMQVDNYNNIVRKKIGFKLPRKWVTYQNTDDIFDMYSDSRIIVEENFENILNFYNTYKKLPCPVIIDQNNFILSQYKIWRFAKDQGIQKIPVIKLENVIIAK